MLLCVAFEAVRIHTTGHRAFIFLIWNLFLAGIPYVVSTALVVFEQRLRGAVFWSLLALWLLFFPNAPYLATDLVHLAPRHDVPLWYDSLMLLCYAWTGLMLGYVSLLDVQILVTARRGAIFGHVVVAASLFLSGFGIYLGRFGRFNSWDALTRPGTLFTDVASLIADPRQNPRTWYVTVAFGVFLYLGYATIRLLMRVRR